jgi:CHASE2 domain-containing sensor protein
MTINQYQIGGSLHPDHPYYIKRKADVDLCHCLQAGQFCYVFNSRQMGKSSLMVQAFYRLQQDGVRCAAIDLSRVGSEHMTAEQWYKGFAVELWQAFELFDRVHLKAWWQDRLDLSPVQRLGQLIEEVLLGVVGNPEQEPPQLVLFLDEVDSIQALDFSLNDFFALIRACYNRRSLNPAYQRLTFALFGVATPSDLMTDRRLTPFNIGQAIALDGFQWQEAQPLAEGLMGYVDDPQATLRDILDWTAGQPFLTQKVCQLVIEQSAQFSSADEGNLDERDQSDQDGFLVAHIIQKFILHSWEFQDEPEHLRTIRDRLLSNPQQTGRLLGLYRQIIETEFNPMDHAVLFDSSLEQMELLLSGLVANRQGRLVVKNRIYRAIFNTEWINQQINQLRPYAVLFEAWKAHPQESYLLQGQVLQEALTWAAGKHLSDEDYQFLAASQAWAKRQAEIALEVIEQASHLLAIARQQANQTKSRHYLRWDWLPKIALSIVIPIILLRLLGVLQGLEWDAFDQFVRWRSPESHDPRIAIVAIDEQDITQMGYPLSDRILVQTLTAIRAQNPRAIGLDIYRDLPVEPGYTDLVKLFQSSPNLFGIEKVVGHTVAPPPILQQMNQVGFADQVEDSDGKVRRALLAVSVEGQLSQALAVKLALHYLEDEGITLQPVGDRLQLGHAVFERFQPNDGGYVRAQSGGYQILLNFRGTEDQFDIVPLRQVLNRQVPPHYFSDRIVLIGTTAESIRDTFLTPYSARWGKSPTLMTGVTLHANIVSQLLSAAFNERPLIRVWTNPCEWVGILGATGLAIWVGWRCKTLVQLAIAILLLSSGLIGGCFVAFLQGWWLPLVPMLMGVWGGALALLLVAQRQFDQIRFQRTLAYLLQVQKEHPTAGRIAIAYLKQSETKENQAAIDRHMKQLHY